MEIQKKDTNREIIENIKKSVPQYANIDQIRISLQRMSGITNQIYKVQVKDDPNIKKLIYRKFGQSQENPFLKRQLQKQVYKFLSKEGAGPHIYQYNEQWRVEQFIPSRTIRTAQMLNPQYYEKLAFNLRRFHDLKPQDITNQTLFGELLKNNSVLLEKSYAKMNKKQIFSEQQLKSLEQLKKMVCEEQFSFLQQLVQTKLTKDLVFSHNDLLAGNILILNKDQSVMFIDFEYSKFNYRIFDIANYFCEAAYDYELNQSPYFKVIQSNTITEKHKLRFIQCYCIAQQKDYDKYKQNIDDWKMSEQAIQLSRRLKKQLFLGEMLSQMMWGCWSILVSKNPVIKFDYISFAMERQLKYNQLKAKMIKKQQ